MKCAKCGTTATIYNKSGVPVCSRHKLDNIKSPTCPECKSPMAIREGKYGKFWGCSAYPMCDGLMKL